MLTGDIDAGKAILRDYFNATDVGHHVRSRRYFLSTSKPPRPYGRLSMAYRHGYAIFAWRDTIRLTTQGDRGGERSRHLPQCQSAPNVDPRHSVSFFASKRGAVERSEAAERLEAGSVFDADHH